MHIRALRHIAGWPYRKIAIAVSLPLSTVYYTAPKNPTQEKRTRGQPWMRRPELQHTLIDIITESAENRTKPLTEIADMAGIKACSKTLPRSLALDGYHRRVARKKPFLNPTHIRVCFFFLLVYCFALPFFFFIVPTPLPLLLCPIPP